MTSPHWFAALLICCAGLPWALAPAQAQAPAVPALPARVMQLSSIEGITEYRLANGLQVLLVPDASKASTTVNLTYRVGSRHENYGETGMAHLLEHLIFKGTPSLRNVQAELGKRGLRYTGSTSTDRTNYFASFTANDDNLRWYLDWSASAMVSSLIAKSDLDSEMTVVRNELEMGENNPSRVLFQRTLSAMYDWHNYGKSTIGARSDVENVDIERLQAFYKLYYQPDNATLIVAGRFDAGQVLAWVAQSFGLIPQPKRVLPPTYTLDGAQDGERQITVRRVGGTPVVYMAHHVPPGAHPDFAAVALLAQVLGDAPGGRLHKALVEKQLAAGTFGFPLAFAEPGALIVGAQLAPGQDLEAARHAMAAVLDGLSLSPVTAEELERARTQWINSWEQGFTDPEVVGVALSDASALGEWRLYVLQRDHLKRATLADVQRVAGEQLRADNRTVALYRPVAEAQRAPAPARVDVAALVRDYKGDNSAVAVAAFDASPAKLDALTQISQLPSGLRMALLPKATRGRAVQARLALHYGDQKSLMNLETVASLVAAVIDKGAAGLSRQQISDGFDRLRAEVSIGASNQTLSVSISTVREQLPAVVQLLGQVLRTPTFPADALEEARRQGLTAIERQRKEPGAVISNALDRLGNPYPRGDLRYEATFDEAEQDLKAVTTEQLRAFHRQFYSAANAQFSAVGDFDPAAVKQALQAALGDWARPAAGAQAYTRVPRPLTPVPAQRLVLDTPDKQNANFSAVLPLPLNDLHPDYPALQLASHIFGSGGSGRLWKRIRETEGLSYGVGSGVQWGQEELSSRWVSDAIFAPQNQARVEAAWREELARSLKDGFTQTELDEARGALLNLRRLGRAQDAAVAGQALNNLRLQRRFVLSQTVDDQLAASTLDQVNAAWRKYITPERVATAWGGDFKPRP